MPPVENFVSFYKDFDVQNQARFEQLYAKEIQFQDPFHTINGREHLYRYFVNMMKRVDDCRFEIHENLANETSAVVIWDMFFKHSMINGGNEITVSGTTQLKFNTEQVIYHRDYFDSSQLVYKHIPIIGHVIRFIEGRMG